MKFLQNDNHLGWVKPEKQTARNETKLGADQYWTLPSPFSWEERQLFSGVFTSRNK